MNHLEHLIKELERNVPVFASLLQGLSTELVQWRPAPEKWNLLEIVCHLHDEEIDDFRTRVKQTLEDPMVTPPSIDPEGWVISRNYAGQDYEKVLESFLTERRASLEWLRSLQHPNWKHTWQHPRLGPLSAGLLLENWVAHDYLHIRQILQRKYGYLTHLSGENLHYAGEW
jgi:hypothetical protein